MKIKILLFALMLIQSAYGIAQQKEDFTIYNRQLSISSDGTIHLNAMDNDGIAWLKGKEFSSGTIEFDVKGRDVLQESFVGLAFHGVNDTTFEVVYFRPFNFKAADPERHAHAVQYIAVPGFDWPKLRAEFHNQYEKPLADPPDPNGWFHVSINVKNDQIAVYVNHQANPVLSLKPLTQTGGTKIGYWVGNGSPGDFRNLTVVAK